jgi:SPP1 family predicted phage head-tail adaptor
MTAAGRMNRRLVLEAPVDTPDGAGGAVRSYRTVVTVWASVEPETARGGLVADAQGATATHRITIRMRDDVTTRHRFRDGGRIYRIVALHEEPARFLTIRAERRTD